jgi:aromatic-L-amino-acid/L-tryptophan decarboxylase
MCVVAALGTTGVTAIDPLEEIGKVCNEFKVWLHVDAAMSGSALILPEYRWMMKGIEMADSFVFNPHKWLFTNFDCSAFFVKDKLSLIKTFQIVPEYLKTVTDGQVNNYCDWGIQLGRRFRALKLWTVIRSFGLKELQEKIRYHISLANILAEKIKNESNFELITPVTINLVCFRYKPTEINEVSELNKLNEKLLHTINATGKIYLTHTNVFGKYTIRMVIGQTNVDIKHVNKAWELIKETANSIVPTP